MLTIEQAKKRTEAFLAGQMLEALRAVDYEVPSFDVHRLVVVYRVPALDALDAATLAVRLDRWRIGAEHAGWKFGWRDAPIAGDVSRHYVETYCYAFAGTDFLEDEQQQLYWRTDIVQMTRYYMLEATRCGIRLSPRRAGFPV